MKNLWLEPKKIFLIILTIISSLVFGVLLSLFLLIYITGAILSGWPQYGAILILLSGLAGYVWLLRIFLKKVGAFKDIDNNRIWSTFFKVLVSSLIAIFLIFTLLRKFMF